MLHLLATKYAIKYENEKKTCDGRYKIGQRWRFGSMSMEQGTSNCRGKCDEKTECKLFYYNDAKWCVLYRSCDQSRVPSFKGTTFEKQAEGIALCF